ncbi:DinB family protein [Alicyclobacillus sp. SO9]|uniref:DinB family protein n=1 Tax=Alicyclobacillus sp. SO9 TaxID=2665646 RepID=UPI0018E7AFA6|nr:DinB family protein [Alicyclobacillus sp. SO9]QQE80061.1 DinB family protein [Alicyclobacillus sp. SO9]
MSHSADNTRDLYHYHVWANNEVFRHLRTLPANTATRRLQSVFPTIHDALAHIYIVDHVWLTALKGDFAEINTSLPLWQQTIEKADLPQMESEFAETAEEYAAFLREHQNLDTVSEYPHPTYGTLKASYREIIGHVVNHGTYHRGNVTAMLRQLGHRGTPTDYVMYLYTAKSPIPTKQRSSDSR